MPQSSAHCPRNTPTRFAANHVVLTLPGIASILPPSAGIHHECTTSQSGAVTSKLDGAPLGRPEPVDRDDAVRVAELPRELRAGHLDDEVLLAARGGGDVLDPGQLREDERGDREEDHDGRDRPRDLEPVGAVDLRAVRVARPVSPPVADDEHDEQHLDEQEDRDDEGGDEPPALADALRVRRLRRDRREAAVARECPRSVGEQRDGRAGDGGGVPPEAHGAGIL